MVHTIFVLRGALSSDSKESIVICELRRVWYSLIFVYEWMEDGTGNNNNKAYRRDGLMTE